MRFVVISDTHYFAPGRGRDGVWWNRTLQSRTLEVGAAMVEVIREVRPDFVVHCGDLTGFCAAENYEAAMAIVRALPCPMHVAIGNHDTWFPGVRTALARELGVPGDRNWYGLTLGGIRFVFLDVCWWKSVDGAVSPYLDKELFDAGLIEGLCAPQEELDWLRAELDAHADEPVVLASHAPLGFRPSYRVGTLPDGTAGGAEGNRLTEFNGRCGRNGGDVANREEIRALLRGRRNVNMALSGHVHIASLHVEEGIAFCMTAAMREYPFELRVMDVQDGLLHASVCGLAGTTFAEASYLPERGNSWVSGAEADRTFTLRLRD